ncbi:MAG: fibronectin type III domain-containing protein, partial [Verrucomicrobia bacterium]|nr:fibronectin type III domain-containing protein [Verrucomicrobiota bacterium]
QDIFLDKITLENAPAAVSLNSLVPGLRSVELTWTPTTLGSAFQRYEVYRATHPTVTVQDTPIGSFADPAVTSLTDIGLSIGTTYYYRVFAVNANDTFAPSNERSTTTVPLTLPVTDSLDTVDSWVTSGTWGIETSLVHQGTGALSDSPNGDYANSTDTWALTAVDLRGTSWPVLRFWDRYRLADNDWGRLEVSPDGGNWTIVYGAAGLRPDWAEQSIDLSPWKNQGNLRIRFRLLTDGGTTEDGWSIDQLAVLEHTPVSVTLPFQEGFEGDLSRWLHAGWSLTDQQPYAGTQAIWDTPSGRMTPDTQLWLVLGGEINLVEANDPQLTFWVRGQLTRYSYLRTQVSNNGGLTWADQATVNLNSDWSSDWTRLQVPLAPYAGQTIRLRFQTSCDYRAPAQDIFLDKITLENAPAAVSMLPISDVQASSLRLTWSASTLPDFQEYRIYRSESPTVNEASTLLGTITDRALTQYPDSGLWSRRTYYYRVFVYNANDTGTGSNQASATTAGVGFPFNDNLEQPQAGWTFTGTWAPMPGAGLDGGHALVDSPGDYAPSTESFAQFGVDLTGHDWPILRFQDRHAIAIGDFGMLWISPDAGVSWHRVYSVAGTRAEWKEQVIDLSPWKNRDQVWVRFVMRTDGGIENDGWSIDDIKVENLVSGAIAYPFFETFEHGLDHWLPSSWALSDNRPQAGSWSAHDTPAGRIGPDTALWLTLAGELNLATAVNPQLTFWVRGQLTRYSYFRVQVSTDGGLAWADLPAGNLNSDWSGDWTRIQLPLAAHAGAVIRLRFQVSSDYRAPEEDIFLDQIGIGEDAPGAPTLLAPLPSAIVEAARPTLVVLNAVEYQSEPVVYHFEVYADATLSMLAAQNPGVASGPGNTSWQVDVNLQNNHQYWWRSRAVEGEHTGPWMPTATFYVNELNNPPLPVAPVISPSWILANTNGTLTWYPTTDPDLGDSIRAYHLQVSADADFATPLINADTITTTNTPPAADWTISIPLSRFTGSASMVPGTVYYWRVRAQDSRYLWSAWNEIPVSFAFVHLPPPPPTNLQPLRFNPDGTITLEWEGASADVRVEYSPSLSPANWTRIGTPVNGTTIVITPDPAQPTGFYRLRLQ